MATDAVQYDPLYRGDGDDHGEKFDATKSAALWTEAPLDHHDSDETPPVGMPPPPPSSSNPLSEWKLELFGLAFSIGCMASIIAILSTYQDRPQADWRGGALTITGTLAVFSTAANLSAALAVGACISQYKWLHFKRMPRSLTDLDLLEEASRGPLGSLLLLVKQPMGLASIGAAVTLLALGVSNKG